MHCHRNAPSSIAAAAKMMGANNTTPLFTIDLIEKDLGYIVETAIASGAELPGAENARAAFRRAQGLGSGRSNVSALGVVFAVLSCSDRGGVCMFCRNKALNGRLLDDGRFRPRARRDARLANRKGRESRRRGSATKFRTRRPSATFPTGGDRSMALCDPAGNRGFVGRLAVETCEGASPRPRRTQSSKPSSRPTSPSE